MQQLFLICITVIAVVMDLWKGKISNVLIISGYVIGWSFQLADKGMAGLPVFLRGITVPVILLSVLFYFRMLGAGDIKLLSVLGGFLGASAVLCCLLVSFLAGGVISLVLLLWRRNFMKRILYFIEYIQEYARTKNWKPYRGERTGDGHLYFSIPVLIAVLLYIITS